MRVLCLYCSVSHEGSSVLICGYPLSPPSSLLPGNGLPVGWAYMGLGLGRGLVRRMVVCVHLVQVWMQAAFGLYAGTSCQAATMPWKHSHHAMKALPSCHESTVAHTEAGRGKS